MSWNQTGGSSTVGSGVSHAKIVFVLPFTRPQFTAPTRCFSKTGRQVSKRLLRVRAMYSVQIIGRPIFASSRILVSSDGASPYQWNVTTSEFSNIMALLAGWSCHQPAVIGCDGLAALAHSKDFARSGRQASM